jgi:hypothetical protein
VRPIAQIFARKAWTLRTLAATKFELFITDWSHWTGLEARGGHEEDVGLLLEAWGAPEPPLTIARAWRREVATASHLGAIPRHVFTSAKSHCDPRLLFTIWTRDVVSCDSQERSSSGLPMAPLRAEGAPPFVSPESSRPSDLEPTVKIRPGCTPSWF